MISLNLLPDIKKEYLKAEHTKNMFIMGAILVSAFAVTAVILVSLYVFGVQKIRISGAQGSIDKSIHTLKSEPDLDKLVTIQNQLKALPALHEGTTKPSRIFEYLKILTPNDVGLSTLSLDLENKTMELRGSGKDFKAVNTFVDTLKNATYSKGGDTTLRPAFSDVVLEAIGKDKQNSSVKITLSFDFTIFDPNVTDVKMTVPSITSTRSQTESPNALFNQKEQGNGKK